MLHVDADALEGQARELCRRGRRPASSSMKQNGLPVGEPCPEIGTCAKLASPPDLFERRAQQFVHGAANLVVGLRHRLGVEIGANLAEHVLVAGFLEIGCTTVLA